MTFKCKRCGGDIRAENEAAYGTCEYCGTTSTLPKVSDEKLVNLFNRANHFRRQNEFDKALGVYESLLNEENANAEAHWCAALCRYGIEYVEDPRTHERVPTCHRVQYRSILEDVDYLAALDNAPDSYTRRLYEAEAKKINEIQKGILAISQREEPFDVFICYKETSDGGERTKDSVLAQDIYYQLTNEGCRVFFAKITLEDKLGQEYEPYIFAALNSAKVMLVVGTKPEHLSAVWVKNEWSRFLALSQDDRSRVLIPCYRDMDPYDLPDEFSHLQAQDMGKIGFIQDLVWGVKKVLGADKKTEPSAQPEVVVTQGTGVVGSVEALLKRANLFLEDGDFEKADNFFEQVLNADPENARAYVGKVLVNLKIKQEKDLAQRANVYSETPDFQKALRFADANYRKTLDGYVSDSLALAEYARKDDEYNEAVVHMNRKDYETAIKLFESIAEHRDSAEQAKACRYAQADDTYNKAVIHKNARNYEFAISVFESIAEHRDSAEQATECQQLLIEKKNLEKEREERYKTYCLQYSRQMELQKKIKAAKANAEEDKNSYYEAIRSSFENDSFVERILTKKELKKIEKEINDQYNHIRQMELELGNLPAVPPFE